MMDTTTIDMLMQIRERPGIYLGTHSISLLSAFVGGFMFAKTNGFKDSKTGFNFESDFTDWMAKKFDIMLSINWSSIILMQAYADSKEALKFIQDKATPEEKKALDLFYEYLDEYIQENKEQEAISAPN